VADIVRFARRHDIPVSTRGSVANSLVAYCIGITTVDPIAHDLLFERFLNPARSSLPDIDLDFCSVRRDEVLEYVRQTYGADARGAGRHDQHAAAALRPARDGQSLRAGRDDDRPADQTAAGGVASRPAPPRRPDAGSRAGEGH
jgi:hypothetical protein